MAAMSTPSSLEALLGSAPSEATPFLLALARQQAARRRPADLLRQQRDDPFVAPSPLDQRLMNRLDALALDAAEGFAAVQLSPVAPLGVCSAVAPTSQDRTLTASRGTEVVSDPTNALALLCAERLRHAPRETVRLCTAHQVLRAQSFRGMAGFTQHFRMFALVEAGRSRASDGFEVAAFVRHVGFVDRLFDAAGALGCAFPDRRMAVFVGTGHRVLGDRVIAALGAALPHAEIAAEEPPKPYYDGLRVLYGGRAPSGDWIPIADTGRFDWMARLTANRRMRFIASGLGLQLVPLLFGPPT